MPIPPQLVMARAYCESLAMLKPPAGVLVPVAPARKYQLPPPAAELDSSNPASPSGDVSPLETCSWPTGAVVPTPTLTPGWNVTFPRLAGKLLQLQSAIGVLSCLCVDLFPRSGREGQDETLTIQRADVDRQRHIDAQGGEQISCGHDEAADHQRRQHEAGL